jgi:hypothetical protein
MGALPLAGLVEAMTLPSSYPDGMLLSSFALAIMLWIMGRHLWVWCGDVEASLCVRGGGGWRIEAPLGRNGRWLCFRWCVEFVGNGWCVPLLLRWFDHYTFIARTEPVLVWTLEMSISMDGVGQFPVRFRVAFNKTCRGCQC